MKFNRISFNRNYLNIALLLVRVFIGFAMITHGYPKLQQLFSGKEVQFFDFLGLGAKNTLGLTVFSEFVCSIFLILGLFTRLAVIPLIISTFIATFVFTDFSIFSKIELSLLYLCIYVLILAAGPGKYSIDGMIDNKPIGY